jgi:hypothetical protein
MTSDSSSKRESVIGSLPAYEWSSEETAAYEAAVEAINGVVGAYSARIAAEEVKPDPNVVVIAALSRASAVCATEREGLDPTDQEGIAEVRRRYAALADEIRGGRA